MKPLPRRGLSAACLAITLAANQATAQPLALREAPAKGEVVPSFETTRASGGPESVKVQFPKGSRTVLLFFLSGCPVCHRMIPEWNRAFERKSKDLRVFGVLMDQEPPGFWSSISITFPVLRAPGREFLRALNVNRAPVTVRVGEGGRIEDVALGPVDAIRLGELFRP